MLATMARPPKGAAGDVAAHAALTRGTMVLQGEKWSGSEASQILQRLHPVQRLIQVGACPTPVQSNGHVSLLPALVLLPGITVICCMVGAAVVWFLLARSARASCLGG
jgi:hypothetical protein